MMTICLLYLKNIYICINLAHLYARIAGHAKQSPVLIQVILKFAFFHDYLNLFYTSLRYSYESLIVSPEEKNILFGETRRI